jgi:hypothetical protein
LPRRLKSVNLGGMSSTRTPPATTPGVPVCPTPSAQPARSLGSLRAVWTAIILLVGTLVGSAAGLLSVAGGMLAPLAIIAGSAAFGGTVALLLVLAQFLTGEHNQ